jgi:PleD family two-component response regulator
MSALVLVAEADPFNLRLLTDLCSTLGYDVVTAGDGGAVLDSMARERPHLLLMDVALPVLDGLSVLRILKADPNLARVPVLLATADNDEAARRLGIELGAEDYVSKPYRSFEVQQRLRNLLRMQAAAGTISSYPPDRPELSDDAPGLGTPSQFRISLDYEFTRAVRYGHPLGCVVVRCAELPKLSIDVRRRAVTQLASVLRGCIRTVDQLFRSGEDTFSILLPETSEQGCAIVLSRIAQWAKEGSLLEPELAKRAVLVAGAASYPHQKVADAEGLWARASATLAKG